MVAMAPSRRSSAFLAVSLVAFSLQILGSSALAASDTASCAAGIPASLAVPAGISSKEMWQAEAVVPLELNLGQVTKKAEISVSSMINEHTNTAGAVAFVVRRPG